MNNTTQINSLYPVANAVTSSGPFVDAFMTRDPTQYDTQYPIQKKWLNTLAGTFWELEGFTSTPSAILANWIKIGSTSLVESLQGNTGAPVPPNGTSVINVVGDTTTITTSGNPGTNTLTISSGPTVATLYTEDSGTAVPALGNLNIKGAAGITTQGAGSTVTVTAGATIATIYTENTGTATPALNNLNILGTSVAAGTTPVKTTGSGSTVTVDIQTSQAIAATNATNIGLAAFNNAQFTVDANGFVSLLGGGPAITTVNVQTFTTSGTYTPTANMVYCTIEVVGGGGGSGSCPTTNGTQNSAAGGGGGGGYARKTVSAATIGVLQVVTIGAGGAGGAIGSNNGFTGGTTSVGALVSATGGAAGFCGIVTNTGSASIETGGVGGAGSGGDINSNGFPASAGMAIMSFDPNGVLLPGFGGGSIFGGGAGGEGNAVAAHPGTSYGGGASGGAIGISTSSIPGAAGFAGIAIITEYIT